MRYCSVLVLFVSIVLTTCSSSTNNLVGTWVSTDPVAELVVIDANNAYLRIDEEAHDGTFTSNQQDQTFQFNWGLTFLAGSFDENRITLNIDGEDYQFSKESNEPSNEALAYHNQTAEEKQLQRKFEAREGNGTKPGEMAAGDVDFTQEGLEAMMREVLERLRNGELSAEEQQELGMTEEEIVDFLNTMDSLKQASGVY